MFLLMHAEWNCGFSGGYSYHGIKIQDEAKKWFKPTEKSAHGGYVKGYLNYTFNMVNNLDIGVEGFIGHSFKDVEDEETSQKVFAPGVFYGLVAKPKLDFDDNYNLYLIVGIQFSHPKIYDFDVKNLKYEFDDRSKRHWFINPVFGCGFCYYVNDSLGAFVEATYTGLSSGDVKKKDETVLPAKNEALRVGIGINVKFG